MSTGYLPSIPSSLTMGIPAELHNPCGRYLLTYKTQKGSPSITRRSLQARPTSVTITLVRRQGTLLLQQTQTRQNKIPSQNIYKKERKEENSYCSSAGTQPRFHPVSVMIALSACMPDSLGGQETFICCYVRMAERTRVRCRAGTSGSAICLAL